MKQLVQWFFLFFLLTSCVRSELQSWDDANFQAQLDRVGHAFVKFFSPTCPHCKRIASVWEDLADEVADVLTVVEVDCSSSGTQTCIDYEVNGYPTLKYIKRAGDGTPKENFVASYEKARELKAFVQFALFHALPAFQQVKGDSLSQFMENKYDTHLLAVFDAAEGAESTVKSSDDKFFATVKQMADDVKGVVKMAYTTDVTSVKSKFPALDKAKLPAILLMKPTTFQYTLENQVEIEDNIENLIPVVQKHTFGLVPMVTEMKDPHMAYPRITLFMPKDVTTDSDTYSKYYTALAPLAKKHPGYQFNLAYMAEFGEKAYRLGLDSRATTPLLFAETDRDVRYLLPETTQHLPSLDKLPQMTELLITQLEQGKLKKFIRSEPVPSAEEFANQLVKTVVGESFESVVLDETKDVMIEIYAPWCGHCKKLAPVYEQVATTLKSSAKNLVIAKIDGTANDVPSEFNFRGFPTIYFSKIGKKSQPMQYTGGRDHDSFIKWLKSRVTHPFEEQPMEKEEL